MPTRFYFPATGYPFPPNINKVTTPAYSGQWNVNPQPPPGRSVASFYIPVGTPDYYQQTRSDGDVLNPYREMLQQYITEPIPARSFTGADTWYGQFACSEITGSGGNVCGAVVITACSNDGSTSRGILLNWRPTAIGATPDAITGTGFSTGGQWTNRIMPPVLASSAVTVYNGDRLIFEIGYDAITLLHTGGSIRFNSSGNTDFAQGNQADTDQTKNCWIECSADLFGGRACRTRATT